MASSSVFPLHIIHISPFLIYGMECLLVTQILISLSLILQWFELLMNINFIFSEVRIEGLETLDYLDNLCQKERFTEQGDALTFESEVKTFSIDMKLFQFSRCSSTRARNWGPGLH